MERKVSINLRKRREKIYEFYYMVYGQMIKKRRLELNYTQEFVARAICSDTYISKAENSQVVIGDDQLYRIMEKLNIAKDEFGKPETLVYYLEKIIEYFYYKDLESYKKIVDKVEDYQFHVVAEIIKLGYYILNNDYDTSKKISDQLIDYLNSMDDLAFTIYLIFSSVLNVKLNKYALAQHLIDAMYVIHTDYPELHVLHTYTRFIIYGKSHQLIRAERLYPELTSKLVQMHNYKLLKEVMVWKALFNEYNIDGEDVKYMKSFINDVDTDLTSEYLLVRAFNRMEPEKYIHLIKNKESEYYLIGLYLCAREAKKNKNNDLYKKYQKQISDLHYKIRSSVDYNNLLNLESKDNYSFYKEYLINPCLKRAKNKGNIFLMNQISHRVVDILKNKNRYKDALNYKEKLKIDIKRIIKQ